MTCSQGFDRYCTTNNALWGGNASAHLTAAIPRVIFVDLWHDNIQYVLRSLLISKYLQRLQPARLIGLAGRPGVTSRSCGALDVALIERLGQSFGVDQIVHTVPAGLLDFSHADHLLDSLDPTGRPASPELLRDRLAKLTLDDGFPIGRLIYDTTLRSELRPTIERVDSRLRHWAADCLRVYRWIQDLIQTQLEAPISFVTGHLDYNPWGLVGEAVRRAGGEVLWFRLEANVPLVRIGGNEPGTLNAAYHRAEADWFERVIWPLRQDLAVGVQEFVGHSASGVLHQRWTAVGTPALSAATAAAAAAALRSGYGWTNTDVVIGIFAHALSDQPLADEQAYADRYQWLSETLAFAARHTERCWVVKLHPRDTAYDATGSTDELIQRYGRLSHIRFIRAQVATGLMAALCDCAVTLFGAPGLEFAALGLPVIVAGGGPYAGCGFVHRAADRAHYEELLVAEPAALQLGGEQVERAQLYTYAARVVGAASSPLLDPITTAATEAYWELAEARLRHHTPASDDLYESMRRLFQGDGRRSANPNIDRLSWPNGTVASGAASDTLPVLGAEPLGFCEGGSGVAGLLKGFGAPDTLGVWAIETACVIGFRLSPLPTGTSVWVSLAYRSLGAEPDWPWPAASVFANQSCLVERVTLEQMSKIDIEVPASIITENGTVALAVLVDHLGSPAEMGLNADSRALGIGLLGLSRLVGDLTR